MKHVSDVARREGIPVQVALTGGTTDGAALQTFDLLMIPLAVAVRYVHSPTEVMSIRDYSNLVRLLALIAGNMSRWA